MKGALLSLAVRVWCEVREGFEDIVDAIEILTVEAPELDVLSACDSHSSEIRHATLSIRAWLVDCSTELL